MIRLKFIDQIAFGEIADPASAIYAREDVSCATIWVTMRDQVRLVTDLYRPPWDRGPAILFRTPYGRKHLSETLGEIARRGYFVVAQDCRGTGDSELDVWDCYIFERKNS